jgi:hypothetical protein
MADDPLNDRVLPWVLEDQSATLRLGRLRGALDFARPELGLSTLHAGHEALPGRLLQVEFTSSAASQARATFIPTVKRDFTEFYLREGDAVADYPASESFPFRSLVYWRVLPSAEPPAVAALEAIVSTQTDLLDSHPRISVSTSLPALELWRLTSLEKAEFKQISLTKAQPQQIHYSQGPGCYLWRLSGERWSFAEMLPPSDFHSTDIMSDGGGMFSLSHRLFERSLEKGVILRARVRGVLLERGRDAVCAIQWYRDLLQSELPLTA